MLTFLTVQNFEGARFYGPVWDASKIMLLRFFFSCEIFPWLFTKACICTFFLPFHIHLLHFLPLATENCSMCSSACCSIMSRVVEQRRLAKHLYKYVYNACFTWNYSQSSRKEKRTTFQGALRTVAYRHLCRIRWCHKHHFHSFCISTRRLTGSRESLWNVTSSATIL